MNEPNITTMTVPATNALPDNVSPGITALVQELIASGGPVVIILLAMSVVALAIVLIKLVQFARVRIGERRFVQTALAQYRNGQPADARNTLATIHNPIARVVDIAIRGYHRDDISEAIVREEITRVAGDEIQNLRSYFRGLEVIATLSLLLGLLGTVLGMIEAFQQLEEAGSQVNPSILSGGIWEALLTTAVGLAVAIPVVTLLNWLESQVEHLAHDMEGAVMQLFTHKLVQPQSGQDDALLYGTSRLQPEG